MKRRRRILCGLAGSLFFAVSCASASEQTEYDDESQAGFLAACRDSVSDSLLVSDVCACVYTAVKSSVDYVDLGLEVTEVEVDDLELLELSPGLEGIVATCISEHARLDG